MHHLTRLSLGCPRTTLAILLAITAVLGMGVPQVRTEFGYRVLIGDEHPSIQTLDALIEQFGGGLPVQIAWDCGIGLPCAHVFDHASLQMANTITRELSAADGFQDVKSPSNAPLLMPAIDGFAVRRFIERDEVVADADQLAARALEDPFWLGNLVSRDGRVGVIVAQPIDTRSETNLVVVETIEDALQPFRNLGFEFRLSGQSIGQVYSGRELDESSGRLIPFTVIVIALVVLMLTRSWQQTLVALGTMGIALLWTVGLMGWLDWPKDGIHEVLAPLILVVGVCDSMHLLARHSVARQRTSDRTAALFEAARDVGPACLITSLTTAAAFLSFTTSALDTFIRFGTVASFGVLACLFLTFSLLPVALRALRTEGPATNTATDSWDAALAAVMRTSQRRSRTILIASAVAFGFFSYGWVTRLSVDNDWNESFGNETSVMKWIRFFEEHLEEADNVELEITLPEEGDYADPEVLSVVSRLETRLRETPPFVSTTSVVTLLERLNRLLHDDDPEFERVAATTAAKAELLELLSLDGAGVVNSWVSLDRSKLRVSIGTPDQSFSQSASALESIAQILEEIAPATWRVARSGEIAITVDWMRDVQATQLRSFPTALAVVFLLVGVYLKSMRLALIALLPTLLPVVATLGAMGWLGFSLDIGRTMIAAVLIGIGVDDAVHVLSHFKTRRENGASANNAITAALQHTGRAVVTTSAALSLGFLTLTASAWQTISGFGLFVSLAILGALASALLVLPVLVVEFGHRSSSPRVSSAGMMHGRGAAFPPAKGL
jgi:predicted RND superfamily exporter protein